MVTLAGDGDAPAAVAEDGPGDSYRPVEIDETATLLDVQLEKCGDRGESAVILPDETRIEAARSSNLAEGCAILVPERTRPIRLDRPGDQS
jgi:hypothetical protein